MAGGRYKQDMLSEVRWRCGLFCHPFFFRNGFAIGDDDCISRMFLNLRDRNSIPDVRADGDGGGNDLAMRLLVVFFYLFKETGAGAGWIDWVLTNVGTTIVFRF